MALYDTKPIPLATGNKLNLYSGLFETPSIPTFDGVDFNAASNNPTIKPVTNGITSGQMIGLASDAMGIYGGYLGARGQVRALKAQAKEYETQMGLNYDAYRRNVNYLAEENLANVARIHSEYQDMLGAQSAAAGASGFDISAGEQRIFRDTEIKADQAKYLENRSTYLQSYELWRSTELENARLKAAAKMARSQAKYTKKMGKLNLLSGALGAAANFISLGSYGKTGDIGVKGV